MTATFTPLQVILRGLGNGLSAITYIMILLLLVFYLFAIGPRPPPGAVVPCHNPAQFVVKHSERTG